VILVVESKIVGELQHRIVGCGRVGGYAMIPAFVDEEVDEVVGLGAVEAV
jgi:hypothetical protein